MRLNRIQRGDDIVERVGHSPPVAIAPAEETAGKIVEAALTAAHLPDHHIRLQPD